MSERRDIKLRVRSLFAAYGSNQVLKDITMDIPANQVTAIIGPSGCGKSTFIRCLNRMHELSETATYTGNILLDDDSIFDPQLDPVSLRRKVGMVFQSPNPFPMMSIKDNVLSGLRLTHRYEKQTAEAVVESALKQAALWEEVKDRLRSPGISLSGGQQQRLCIARALAVEPEVILMDEPCSALDPVATARIEDLIHDLRRRYTIVIVTHNMQQAARVSNMTAFFLSGSLVEMTSTGQLFTSPSDPRTQDYITGKFG